LLWIFLGAPYIEALRNNRALHAALSAITAAVVGVVLNLSVWFTVHTLFAQVDERSHGLLFLQVPRLDSIQWAATLLAAAALVAMLRLRIGMGWTLCWAAPSPGRYGSCWADVLRARPGVAALLAMSMRTIIIEPSTAEAACSRSGSWYSGKYSRRR
jgi:hypothetical protein